jgi:hypothetical protein
MLCGGSRNEARCGRRAQPLLAPLTRGSKPSQFNTLVLASAAGLGDSATSAENYQSLGGRSAAYSRRTMLPTTHGNLIMSRARLLACSDSTGTVNQGWFRVSR